MHNTTHRLLRTTAATPSAEHHMQQHTTCTPEDGHIDCPKHVEIFMIINYNCCNKLVPLVIFIYDARSHIHQISNKHCLFHESSWITTYLSASHSLAPFKTVSSQEAHNGPKPQIISGHGPSCFVFHRLHSCTANSLESRVHYAAS